jgi:hypothetical protein
MATKEWKLIELAEPTWIPFEVATKEWGRIEFIICTLYRRGKLNGFWVYPKQSNIIEAWHFPYTYHNDFGNSSYDNLDAGRAWLFWWCKEHKCPSMSIYAPNNAKYLKIDGYGIEFHIRYYGPYQIRIPEMVSKE